MTFHAPDETSTYDGVDGAAITYHHWDPSTDGGAAPVGIVQLTHGVGEHMLRYGHVARHLTDRGYVVYGQDHRGHGATAEATGGRGEFGEGGWPALVDDIGGLSALARAEHPGLTLTLFAHSMGSFATQQYLLDNGADVDAVVLSGTAALDLLEPAMDLDAPLDLSAFNAPFAPARTDFDWLSRDDAEVDAYIADPGCGHGMEIAGAKAMFAGARRLADPDAVAAVASTLPLLIVAGERDPVNAGLALLGPVADRFRAAGLTDVTVITYPEARHEIVNETNRDEVLADVSSWIDAHRG